MSLNSNENRAVSKLTKFLSSKKISDNNENTALLLYAMKEKKDGEIHQLQRTLERTTKEKTELKRRCSILEHERHETMNVIRDLKHKLIAVAREKDELRYNFCNYLRNNDEGNHNHNHNNPGVLSFERTETIEVKEHIVDYDCNASHVDSNADEDANNVKLILDDYIPDFHESREDGPFQSANMNINKLQQIIENYETRDEESSLDDDLEDEEERILVEDNHTRTSTKTILNVLNKMGNYMKIRDDASENDREVETVFSEFVEEMQRLNEIVKDAEGYSMSTYETDCTSNDVLSSKAADFNSMDGPINISNIGTDADTTSCHGYYEDRVIRIDECEGSICEESSEESSETFIRVTTSFLDKLHYVMGDGSLYSTGLDLPVCAGPTPISESRSRSPSPSPSEADLQTNDRSNDYDCETRDDVNVRITGKALVDALEILMNERDSFLNDLAALYDLEKVGK